MRTLTNEKRRYIMKLKDDVKDIYIYGICNVDYTTLMYITSIRSELFLLTNLCPVIFFYVQIDWLNEYNQKIRDEIGTSSQSPTKKHMTGCNDGRRK